MHIQKVLHKVLASTAHTIHAVRFQAVIAGIESLVCGSFLTVTSLGPGINSTARVKHNIKRMDRLASNRHLHSERQAIYRQLSHYLCRNHSRPIILIDWTDIVERERLMLIRAALAVDGRAIPLYESIYPLTQYNAPTTHKKFLTELRTLLPQDCCPIIITDAGFRGPWFKTVESLGWDWIGRVRNMVNYRLQSRQTWRPTQNLYYRANNKIQYLGSAELSSKRPYPCHLYLYKKHRKGRKANRSVRHFIKHSTSAVFRKQQQDPWLIATNLSPEQLSGKQIVRLYGKRMQIEECFRDIKSDRFGFGFALSRSKCIKRLNVLLLIAALATLYLWWIGYAARQKGWHLHFQANTVRHTHVLSIPFLALAIVQRSDYVMSLTELISVMNAFPHVIQQANQT